MLPRAAYGFIEIRTLTLTPSAATGSGVCRPCAQYLTDPYSSSSDLLFTRLFTRLQTSDGDIINRFTTEALVCCCRGQHDVLPHVRDGRQR